MTGLHRGVHRIPWWGHGLALTVAGLLFAAGLALNGLAASAAPPPRATRYLPGPTTTISYLVEVTVTPGVDGY